MNSGQDDSSAEAKCVDARRRIRERRLRPVAFNALKVGWQRPSYLGNLKIPLTQIGLPEPTIRTTAQQPPLCVFSRTTAGCRVLAKNLPNSKSFGNDRKVPVPPSDVDHCQPFRCRFSAAKCGPSALYSNLSTSAITPVRYAVPHGNGSFPTNADLTIGHPRTLRRDRQQR